MAKKRSATDTELDILDVLWSEGPSEIRELVAAIYGQHTPTRHATIKSLLDRLAEKGLVSCDRSRFAHRFAATVDRETYVGDQLQRLADSHFAGSMAPMFQAMLRRTKLSRAQLESIRRLIEKMP
jgi:predicted transcriptional regulator